MPKAKEFAIMVAAGLLAVWLSHNISAVGNITRGGS